MAALKFTGFIFLVYFTVFTNAGGRFCKKADQKLADLKTLVENIDCSGQASGSCGPSGPSSCKEIYDQKKPSENKAYVLQMDTGKFPVYCNMDGDGLGECGEGGWTLVMKIDGTKKTFLFDSSYWTDKNTYGVPEGETGLDHDETKLPTYWNTPFTKICLGMKIPGENTRFLVLNKEAVSLHALISDGKYRPTSLGRDTWKTLIGFQASLQRNCNKEGFNVQSDNAAYSKVRIGYMSNEQNDCGTGDSRIGFGTGGLQDNSNSCGNEATNGGDNGDKHIKAMGYILVQ
ncbi:putative skeletal organic matrix protein 5 isoform X2 [Oculina patagonica]